MAKNMGYVRYELTVSDFRSCLEALENEGLSNLSSSELGYAKILANLAERYVDAYAWATSRKTTVKSSTAFHRRNGVTEPSDNTHHTQITDDAEEDVEDAKYRAQLKGLYKK